MRRLIIVVAIVALAMTVLVPAVAAAKPDKFVVDNVLEDVACGGTVDIVEKGFVVYNGHTNGKVLENSTYHLDVIYTDGETEVFFRDRGSDLVTFTDDGLLSIKVGGRTSFLDDDGEDGNAHIGNLTILIDFDPFSITTVDRGGQDIEICSYFN